MRSAVTGFIEMAGVLSDIRRLEHAKPDRFVENLFYNDRVAQ